MPKFLFLGAALFSLGSTATFAQIDESNPEALIKTATQQILSEVKRGAIRQSDIQSVMNLMNRDVAPCIDFERITQLALRRTWHQASPDQRNQLAERSRCSWFVPIS